MPSYSFLHFLARKFGYKLKLLFLTLQCREIEILGACNEENNAVTMMSEIWLSCTPSSNTFCVHLVFHSDE